MSTLCVFSIVDFVKMWLSASAVGHMLAASKRRPTPNSLRASMMSCAVTENKRNPHKYKDKCTGSSVESAKTKNGLLFFPPFHRHPHTHTHSSHSLCDNHSLDERRGPPWPSITYRRCDNPCVRFMAMFKVQLLQSKIPHIVFCVLRVCVYINTECCQRCYQLVFLKLISFLGPLFSCVYTQPLASLPSCKLWYLFMLFIWFFYYT